MSHKESPMQILEIWLLLIGAVPQPNEFEYKLFV